jgi:hypothetical protein
MHLWQIMPVILAKQNTENTHENIQDDRKVCAPDDHNTES